MTPILAPELAYERMALFLAAYAIELEKAVRNYPQDYAYPLAQVPEVAKRMSDAIRRNSYNKDSHAIKATCKAFGLKCTYKAIDSFIR